jgi:8-amino-7-oxononanoate synthase
VLEKAGSYRRRLIVTDAVFSMDGDCANLPALCDLRDAHDAILVVDEAHATGVLGVNGAGLAEHQLVAGAIDVTMSTASKALGSLGGLITGPRPVIDTLINQARPFLYSTAVPPTQVAAIEAGLDLVDAEPHRRQRLAQLSQELRGRLQRAGWAVQDDPTPIIPLVVGSTTAALALAEKLADAGFYAPAIRPPTVAVGGARVRVSLRSDLDEPQISLLADAIGRKP